MLPSFATLLPLTLNWTCPEIATDVVVMRCSNSNNFARKHKSPFASYLLHALLYNFHQLHISKVNLLSTGTTSTVCSALDILPALLLAVQVTVLDALRSTLIRQPPSEVSVWHLESEHSCQLQVAGGFASLGMQFIVSCWSPRSTATAIYWRAECCHKKHWPIKCPGQPRFHRR